MLSRFTAVSAAQVAITVSPTNDSPQAHDDAATTDVDTPVLIDVLANDIDPDGDILVIESVTQPSNGTVEIASGNILYTPGSGFYGTDTFIYTVTDGYITSGSAIVTITVNEISIRLIFIPPCVMVNKK